MSKIHRSSAALAAVAALVATTLAGCDVREDGDQDNAPLPASEVSAAPTPTPSPEETAVASIIRDDAALHEPVVELPPDPLKRTVPFAAGGNDLTPAAERILADALRSAAIKQPWPIVLRGHTDSDGNDRANLRASRARAEAVAAWMVEHGVNDDRIEVIAMGEQNPIAPNALPDGEPNEAGRARNRRVDMEIAPRPSVADDSAGDPPDGQRKGQRTGGPRVDPPDNPA